MAEFWCDECDEYIEAETGNELIRCPQCLRWSAVRIRRVTAKADG